MYLMAPHYFILDLTLNRNGFEMEEKRQGEQFWQNPGSWLQQMGWWLIA